MTNSNSISNIFYAPNFICVNKVIVMLLQILLVLFAITVDAKELWHSDFESPDYISNTYLTGQQGWWHYQGWSSGRVISSGNGQKVRIGGANGHGEVILSPWINSETRNNQIFLISMMVSPGEAAKPLLCRILDNSQIAVISVDFDKTTNHIRVRGGDQAPWTDSGISFTSGSDYKLEIVKDDRNWTFSLKVDGVWAVRGISCGNPISVTGGSIYNTVPGIGYIYFLGGDNNGQVHSNSFSYLDDLKVEAIEFEKLFCADFESPEYILNSVLTGQQGWWHYQNWSQGTIVDHHNNNRVCLGGSNGHPEKVLSPWCDSETENEKVFRISTKVTPGTGNEACLIRLLDNNQNPLVNIDFAKNSGNKILAKGADSSAWIDTGISYTSGNDYNVEIIQNNLNKSFDLFINSQMVLRDVPNNTTPNGLGYIYFLAGGNGGVPVLDQFSYIDNVSIEVISDIETLWSANFDENKYKSNSALTDQQGWWHYQNWTQGIIINSQARLGGSNGHPHKVLSPWINKDDSADKFFRITGTVKPGNGSDSCLIRVMDNQQNAVVNLSFDKDTGNKIRVKGSDSSQWIDTGIVYIPGQEYRIEILQNNLDNVFSLCVDDEWVVRDHSTNVSAAGIGYIYFLGGGNDGVFVSDQYTYLDDFKVQVLKRASQYNWHLGAWDRLDTINGPSTLASEGANMTVAYNYPGMTDEQVRCWLDQAYLNGLNVILETPKESKYIVSDASVITAFVNKFKKHPAVCGWYIADEPPINNSTAHSTIKAGYDLIKTLDDKPVHICFTIDGIPAADIPATFNTYSDCYDIMLFDCYITVKDTPEFNYIITSTFQARIDHAQSYASQAGKPWKVVLQGYGRTSNTNQWWARLPTSAELRFMLYYSISKDAEGWFSWCHFLCQEETYANANDPYPYDGKQWIDDVYKPLANEANILAAALSNGKKTGLSDNQSSIISCLYKEPETDDFYIISINNSNGNTTSSFYLSYFLGNFSQAQPLFENRAAIPVNFNRFSDQFSRYGVHIYKLIK